MEIKITFRTQYMPQRSKGEYNSLPSETEQGQSLSVKETLIRFQQGTLINGARPIEYDTDVYGENIDDLDVYMRDLSLDIAEQEEYISDLKNELEFARMRREEQETGTIISQKTGNEPDESDKETESE